MAWWAAVGMFAFIENVTESLIAFHSIFWLLLVAPGFAATRYAEVSPTLVGERGATRARALLCRTPTSRRGRAPSPLRRPDADLHSATVNQRSIARQKAIRTPRAAAIAGIVFAVLMGATQILVKVAIPDGSTRSGDWVTDDSRRRAVVIALNLLPFAGIAFLWFIGVIRDRIGENEDRFFATVFLGSGLLFVAMLFASGAVAAGLLVSPDSWRSAARATRCGRTGGGSPARCSRSTRCACPPCS